MKLRFEHCGQPWTVSVDLGVNTEPAELGCPPFARGFPWMRATIEPPARGYGDALGWIQLVDSPVDANGLPGHLVDPFEPLGEVSHPFCFFGFSPTHFDAPHRSERPDMDWLSYTFLGGIAGHREAFALLGFTWGYSIRDGRIEVVPLAEIDGQAWDSCVPSLQAAYPEWRFVPGFASRPQLSVLPSRPPDR